MMKKVALITTHPIQYYAPLFKLLDERKNVQLKVYYTWGEQAADKFDPGFGKAIRWDLPLLEGYDFQWVTNIAKDPGSHHFRGIDNPDLIPQINSWQPDVILVYGWAYKSHLRIILHYHKKRRIIFRGDSTLLDTAGSLKSVLRSWFLKWVYSHVDEALYAGKNNKAYFQKSGLPEDRLFFAPHAVDNTRFGKDRSTEAAELRKSLGIEPEEILILFAGKFEEKKSPLLLLQAFTELKPKQTHLLFVGNGVLETELKKMAARTARVHLMNFQNQSDMPVVYQSCDLFCLPSKGPGETWGLVVNEAMACARAVLVSDKVGAAADLVTEKVNGMIFKADDLADLKSKLMFLLTGGKNALFTMGLNSARTIANWTISEQADAFEKLINRCEPNH